jgi:hypothetical protein
MSHAGAAGVIAGSLLITEVLTATLLLPPRTEWQLKTSTVARKIFHWREPQIASVGDTPIYASDVISLYRGLPKPLQESLKRKNATEELLDMTITRFVFRQAALEREAPADESLADFVENSEFSAMKTWLTEQFSHEETEPTNDEIKTIMAQNPGYFGIHHQIRCRVDLYTVSTRKRAPKFLKSSHWKIPYPDGAWTPDWLIQLAKLPKGKSTQLYKCEGGVCRYTKEGEEDVTSMPADQIKTMARNQWIDHKISDYQKKFRDTHSIEKHPDRIGGIFDHV